MSAVSCWWDGNQVTDHYLYGVSVLTLARIGKVVAFISGAMVLIDIIGAEKIAEWGRRIKANRGEISGWVTLAIFILFAIFSTIVWFSPLRDNGVIYVVLVIVYLGLSVQSMGWLRGVGSDIFYFIAKCMEYPRLAPVLRAIAYVLFVVGFALDYLGS